GEEEDEIVANALPGEGDDDGDHRIDTMEGGIPQARPDLVEEGKKAGFRGKDETEGEAERRRRDSIRPHEDGAVDAEAAELAVGEEGEDQGEAHRQPGAGNGKGQAEDDRVPVERIAEDGGEIAESYPGVAAAPGSLEGEGPIERFAGGPVEEGED